MSKMIETKCKGAEAGANFGWKIEVGKKPKGLWRPKLTIQIFSVTENKLNIDPSYRFQVFKYEDVSYAECKDCRKVGRDQCPGREKTEYLIPVKFKFYATSNVRYIDYFPKCHNCYRYFQLPRIYNIFENNYVVEMFLEWRPGKPDYDDYVSWLIENVLNPCIAEFERRWAEAETSEETEAVEYSSDNYISKKLYLPKTCQKK
ncbi:MAG: hypothetical protein QXV73_03955 [Candidatus Micrarchaeia archaeon]